VPVVPVFSARTGHGRDWVCGDEPIVVPRHAERKVVDAAAQHIADAFALFVTAHPTHWFAFHD
jgi:lauroyl/myristoyl acyltransferase